MNRQHDPFLLYKCKRSDTVKKGHVYQSITDDEYNYHYDRKSRRMDLIKTRQPNYDNSAQRDWYDAHNFGITPYGVNPTYLRPSSIKFDVFYLSCAIVRRVTKTIRNFTMKQSYDVKKTSLMKFYINLWENIISTAGITHKIQFIWRK